MQQRSGRAPILRIPPQRCPGASPSFPPQVPAVDVRKRLKAEVRPGFLFSSFLSKLLSTAGQRAQRTHCTFDIRNVKQQLHGRSNLIKVQLIAVYCAVNIPYLQKAECVCACVCVWPLTRPCANPAQLQSPLEAQTYRQERKGSGGGGGGAFPMDCTLISVVHSFWQRRCTPLRTCVSCAIAQSFFRPVSWAFRQTSRWAQGAHFGELSECIGAPLVLPTGGDTDNKQRYFITMHPRSISAGRRYDVTKGTDTSSICQLNALRSTCWILFSIFVQFQQKKPHHQEAKREALGAKIFNRLLSLFSAF